jgi:hypothetical protein
MMLAWELVLPVTTTEINSKLRTQTKYVGSFTVDLPTLSML